MSATYYVNPNTGNDLTGNGSSGAPFQSIQFAANTANSGAGPTTIYLQTGVYRVDGSDLPGNEPAMGKYDNGLGIFNNLNGNAATHSVIEPVPGATVWLSGSAIYTGSWTQVGSSNVYQTQYNPSSNLTLHEVPSQVFLNWNVSNNVPSLTQIGTSGSTSAIYGDNQRVINGTNGYANLPSGSFWYNTTSGVLYVNLGAGITPSGNTIEISDIQNVIKDDSDASAPAQYIDFDNLNIVHTDSYAVSPGPGDDNPDAVILPTNSSVNNCSVTNTDFAGLLIPTLAANAVVTGSSFDNNGQSGVQSAGTNFNFSNCQFNSNNTRLFQNSASDSAAGIKVISNRPTPSGVIQHCTASLNVHSPGIWFDTLSGFSPLVINGNYISGNGQFGIDIEATQNAQIFNNVISNNGDAGIYQTASSHSEIYNNTILGNAGNAAVDFTGEVRTVDAFSENDIGTVSPAGSGTYSGGTFTTSGSGADISGTSDDFHFSSLPAGGNQTVVADVTSQTNTNGYAKAGVMIRNSLSASDTFAAVFVTPSNGLLFEYRTASGGATNGTYVSGITTPQWVEVIRSGNNFSGYYSSNGSSWTQIGTTQSIAMGTTTDTGLAVTSHNTSSLSTATFTNVDVLTSAGSLINFATTSNTIENNVIANNYSTYDVAVTTSGAGNTLNCNLYYRRGGPLQMSLGGLYEGNWGPTYTSLSSWQTASGQDSSSLVSDPLFITASGAAGYQPGSNSPAHLAGANLYSALAVDYNQTARPFSGNFDIGAFQVNSSSGVAGTTVTNNDSTVWVDDTLPSQAVPTAPQAIYPNREVLWSWGTATNAVSSEPITPDSGSSYLDLGVANNPIILSGSGSDINGTSDQFHFASMSISGNQTLSADVGSQNYTDPNAKAGVMMRNSSSASDAFAAVFVTPSNGVLFEYRTTSGGSATSTYVSGITVPVWVKLVRSGSSFSGYYSSDGTAWTQIGSSQTISMSTAIPTGLAITSHNNSAVGFASFTSTAIVAGSTTYSGLNLVLTNQDIGSPTQPGSGSYYEQSFLVSNSSNVRTINAGDYLFSWVYIDPNNPPAEIMLQFNSTGTDNTAGWAHRAFWGANNITTDGNGGSFGTEGTASLFNVSSSLPSSGQWHLLAVPASSVGLSAGSQIYGVRITLDTGHAYFDRIGSGSPNAINAFGDADVGSVGLSGAANVSAGIFSVSGSGADISGTSDAFHFSDQLITGNQSVIAEVTSQTNTNGYAKAGVMIRNSNSSTDVFAAVFITPSNGVVFEYRTTSGAATNGTFISGITSPQWVEVVRSGSSFSGYYSSNGTSWTQISTSQSITMGSGAYTGLAVTSHNNSSLSLATFTGVQIVNGANTLSGSTLSFASQDIGSVGVSGSGNYSGGLYTVSGSGADISGTSDAFNFASLPAAGDQTIIAQITSQTNSDTWAKAGLMIRDSLAASDTFAAVFITPSNGVLFEYRTVAGGSTNGTTVTGITGPIWLKLTRTGNSFSGFYSTDGVAWTQIGTSQTVVMNVTTFTGLAVTSHNNSALSTATFTNLNASAGSVSLLT